MCPDTPHPQQQNPEETFQLTVSSQRLIAFTFWFLVGCEVLLVFLDATVNYGEWTQIGAIRRLFNITREDALGNWFQSTLTLFVGLVLWFIFLRVKREDFWRGIGWLLLAVFFTYMAIDDGAKIHERIGTAVNEMAPSEELFDFPSYTWQLVFGPFFGAMGIFILLFLWREFRERKLRIWTIVGLSCFILATGLDFVEGLEEGYTWLVDTYSLNKRAVEHFSRALEEFLEMLGTTFFLISFLHHFTKISPHFSVRFE